MACIGHIVRCRERRPLPVGVAGDIAVVDCAAVCVQRHGIAGNSKLRRECGNACRNAFAGSVKVAIAAKPHKEITGISIRAGQAIGRRSGKRAAVFHNNLNIIGAAADLATVQVKSNGFQSVRAQGVRGWEFKHGTETDAWRQFQVKLPGAGCKGPARRTVPVRIGTILGILPPGIHTVPVFDITDRVILIVLVRFVQNRVPLVACRGAARSGAAAPRRGHAEGVVHAAAGVGLAKNQVMPIQVIPVGSTGHVVVRNKQAVVIGVANGVVGVCAACRIC